MEDRRDMTRLRDAILDANFARPKADRLRGCALANEIMMLTDEMPDVHFQRRGRGECAVLDNFIARRSVGDCDIQIGAAINWARRHGGGEKL